jgi:hypothetical protein
VTQPRTQFLRRYEVADRVEFSTSRDHGAIYLRHDDGRLVAPSLHMDADIKEEFAAVHAEFAAVHAEFATVRSEFVAVRAEMRGSETTLRQEIREEGVSTRRHFDVVAESLRDDIRTIAEGLIALDAKVERMRESG